MLYAKANARRLYQTGSINIGFVHIVEFLREPKLETDFYIRARRAAETSGFDKKTAVEFIAAMTELYNNVIEHSDAIETSYVSYASYRSVFEFVVADSGVGVLQSLKSNSKFKDLDDSGRALELALTEGVSRHDGETDRGRGFRPIFVGLANVSENLRFRSGDHSREVFRPSDSSIATITTQKASLNGFFCSVICRST